MRKILLVSNSGDVVGGGEISLYFLIKHLDKCRFQPVVLCPDRGRFFSKVEALGIQPKLLKMPSLKGKGLLLLPKTVQQLSRLVRREKIRLIHGNGSRCSIYAGLAARLTHVPLLWHVRIMDREPLLDRFLAFLSTKIVTNSQAVAGRFEFISKPEQISVVHNGVDTNAFNPEVDGSEIRKELGLEEKQKLVTILGRMDAWKGHRFFLRAAQQTVKCVDQVTFLVVGDGDLREELQEDAVKLGIADSVLFCGYREDIPKIIAATDVLVLASLAESFGRVVIEAMAMGKPVVATNVGGVPEIIRSDHTGILVELANPDAIAQAVVRLLKDEELSKKIGQAGLRRVQEKFTIEKHVQEIQRVYDSVLSSA